MPSTNAGGNAAAAATPPVLSAEHKRKLTALQFGLLLMGEFSVVTSEANSFAMGMPVSACLPVCV